jgi:hypothetical protein
MKDIRCVFMVQSPRLSSLAPFVILSAAKDLHFGWIPAQMQILRCAQDDKRRQG